MAALTSNVSGLACCVGGYLEDSTSESPLGPLYVMAIHDGAVVGMDRTARVTTIGTPCDLCGLPALTGLPAPDCEIGDRMWTPEIALAFGILRAFELVTDLVDSVSEVNVTDLESPEVILCGGIIVKMGTGDYTGKARRLRQVLIQLEQIKARARCIDLRFAGQVVAECDGSHRGFEKEV
jgi:hypothetical protein